MYMKDLLKQIILEQQEILHAQNKRYVQRYIADEWLQTSEILIISGIRRCGKSVLMQQMRDRLKKVYKNLQLKIIKEVFNCDKSGRKKFYEK